MAGHPGGSQRRGPIVGTWQVALVRPHSHQQQLTTPHTTLAPPPARIHARGYHQHDHHSDASTQRHYHYHVSERQAVATEGHTDLASVVQQGNHIPSSHKERLSSAIIHIHAASWVVTRTNQPIGSTTSWWVFIQTNQLGGRAGHEAADQHTASRQVSRTNQYSGRPTNRPAVQPVGWSHSR